MHDGNIAARDETVRMSLPTNRVSMCRLMLAHIETAHQREVVDVAKSLYKARYILVGIIT